MFKRDIELRKIGSINKQRNLIGSSIDCYTSLILIKRYHKDILVNFDKNDININILISRSYKIVF